jgi:hypothetical protein
MWCLHGNEKLKITIKLTIYQHLSIKLVITTWKLWKWESRNEWVVTFCFDNHQITIRIIDCVLIDWRIREGYMRDLKIEVKIWQFLLKSDDFAKVGEIWESWDLNYSIMWAWILLGFVELMAVYYFICDGDVNTFTWILSGSAIYILIISCLVTVNVLIRGHQGNR